MRVRNVHERELCATPQQVGTLIDSLASLDDLLWPKKLWPRMKFDRPMGVGAVGGHGPIGYVVKSYSPGRAVEFRFTKPKGFRGYHRYEIVSSSTPGCRLRHALEMTTHGVAVLSWPLLFRPMHDALIEDSLDAAETSVGHVPTPQPWSVWVRLLRRLASRRRERTANGSSQAGR